MIRVVVYLVIVALFAFGAVWLADRPGDVVVTWQGQRTETSVMVLIAAVAAVAVAAVLAWSIVRALLRSPDLFAQYLRNRRGVRGYRAVSHGLIAVGSGDARAAKKFTHEASRIAPGEPLTLLLRAQTAQLAGDRATAAATFQEMAERDDTRVLGLHGLFVEAQRRNDHTAALAHAEEAAKHASVPAWAGQAVLEFRCVAGDWDGALTRLERNMKSGLIDKRAFRRQRAVLLTAQALAVEEAAAASPAAGNPELGRERARALALEAVKLAPALVPAAALAARLLGEGGERRKAARIIERAWRVHPHPDLADAYAQLRPGRSARERLARIEALAAKAPGDVEGAIAVARAALDAQEFAVARRALAPFVTAPTKRVAALMAALEMQQGDEGRGREWMARALNARRDPAWTADGFVSDRWLPISPVTGRLDAFEWKDPLAGADHAGAIIDAAEQRAMLEVPVPAATAGSTSPRLRGEVDTRSVAGEGGFPKTEPAESAPHPHPLPASGERERTEPAVPPRDDSRASRTGAMAPVAPAVIPLVHAPDDPGPEAEPPAEPAPEPTTEPPPDGWGRIRALFKP